MVDKNLFLYDLAVVAIMKDEEPYVKEWLEYHLLAGADHFYLYDNDSTPEFRRVLQPYIDAGIVTYIPFPGKARQYEAYNDAFTRFKFDCRYMAIIDGDEFIYPKTKSTINEVVDEILLPVPNASALGVNWIFYGSCGQEKADYSRGVVDRFAHRAKEPTHHVKTIANPRTINFFPNPHYAIYFDEKFSVNENGEPFQGPFNEARTANKISINHYHTKSREEWVKKVERGNADGTSKRLLKEFDNSDNTNSAMFDDSMIKYCNARRAQIESGGGAQQLLYSKKINYPRLLSALMSTLAPTVRENAPKEVFEWKLEEFLTCLNLSVYLRENYLSTNKDNLFVELSLNAIHKALHYGMSLSDVMLLMGELPKILALQYPVAKNIVDIFKKVIPQVMTTFRLRNRWQEFMEMEYRLKLLELIKI